MKENISSAHIKTEHEYEREYRYLVDKRISDLEKQIIYLKQLIEKLIYEKNN